MTPLERAARALCSLEGHPENIKFEGKPMWQSYLSEARAVISAIREPSGAVLNAGSEKSKAIYISPAVQAAVTWQAMIDAILEEKP